MKRLLRFWWVLGVLLIIASGFVGYRYYYQDYPIFADVTKPAEFPQVTWEAIVRGRVVRSIKRQASPLPESVVPISAYIVSGDGFFEEVGVKFVSPANEVIDKGVYVDPSRRPYRWVAGYKTNIREEIYYVLYSQWQNIDGTTSYIPYIFPDNGVFWLGTIDKKYLDIVASDSQYYLAPVMKFVRKEICIASMGKLVGYCEWIASESKLAKYEQMLIEWGEGEIIPERIERFPVMYNRQLWVRGEPGI